MDTKKMGWAKDESLSRLHRSPRMTFTMPREEYDRAALHTEAPDREGWEPYWIAKQTDVVRWNYRPVPVTREVGSAEPRAKVLS